MEKVIILHNPNAGDENHMKSSLINFINENGYKPLYYEIKKTNKWKKKLSQADLVIVAGGDGTVRRLIKVLVNRTLLEPQVPIAILPMGTANNIWKVVHKNSTIDVLNFIAHWSKKNIQFLDMGVIGIHKKMNFFLESAGFGVIPLLIKEMDNIDVSHLETKQDELTFALQTLHQLILKIPAQRYQISTTNGDYKAKAIMVEVMNSPYIGPNFHIAQTIKIDDGLLDIVIVTEEQRAEFAHYIKNLIDGKVSEFIPKIIVAEKCKIITKDKDFHMDDELLEVNQRNFNFEVRKNIIGFV